MDKLELIAEIEERLSKLKNDVSDQRSVSLLGTIESDLNYVKLYENLGGLKDGTEVDINEFAMFLDGREYGSEITREESERAKELGFVVVYGASDDLAEFEGAIYDEADCFGGGQIYLEKDGLFAGCECECQYSEAVFKKCKVIKAVWGEDGYSWQYKTDIPHATFEIYDNGEKYCKGIVFKISELSN